MPKTDNFITRYFDGQSSTFNTIIGLVFCSVIGVFDLVTHDDYIFSLMYILPIVFSTWYVDKNAGILISAICTAFLAFHHSDKLLIVSIWNNLSMFGIFCVVTLMLSRIRQLLENESTLARTDPLTGIRNLRSFSELVEYEALRLRREGSPFSIAYFDIDDFKKVNDTYGHKRGDKYLKELVSCLRKHLRKTDIFARMGGDEFVIFFPATGQNSVKVVTQKVREGLDGLSRSIGWLTTISMGVVTSTNGTCDLDDIITAADKLMYEVKHAGKNNVLYAEYSSPIVTHKLNLVFSRFQRSQRAL
jgi:diguanylate cyclase (GGDEF)-like protein